MSFHRETDIDITRPDADTEHSAIMDLDTDLTAGIENLNTLTDIIGTKLAASSIGAASGVCDLDADRLVPESRIPTYPVNKLPTLLGYPIGAIVAYPVDAVAASLSGVWAECNGAALSPSTYSDLYAVVGDVFGTSASNFKLPDLRGRFPRGWDHGAGIDLDAVSRTDSGNGTTGDSVGTLQACQNKSHPHNFLTRSGVLTNTTPGGTEYYSPGNSDRDGLLKTYGGTQWEASKAVSVGDEFVATTWNSRKYSCTKAGITDSTEPTWSSYAVGDTVTDGTAQWIVELNTLSEFRPPNINVMFIIRIA